MKETASYWITSTLLIILMFVITYAIFRVLLGLDQLNSFVAAAGVVFLLNVSVRITLRWGKE